VLAERRLLPLEERKQHDAALNALRHRRAHRHAERDGARLSRALQRGILGGRALADVLPIARVAIGLTCRRAVLCGVRPWCPALPRPRPAAPARGRRASDDGHHAGAGGGRPYERTAPEDPCDSPGAVRRLLPDKHQYRPLGHVDVDVLVALLVDGAVGVSAVVPAKVGRLPSKKGPPSCLLPSYSQRESSTSGAWL
jgi:hypothetical protein